MRIYLSSHLALLTCTDSFGPIMSLPEPMVVAQSQATLCAAARQIPRRYRPCSRRDYYPKEEYLRLTNTGDLILIQITWVAC